MEVFLAVLVALLALVVVLVLVVLVRTLSFHPPVAPPQSQPDFDPGEVPAEVIGRLQEAIRIPTVSKLDYAATNFAPFDEFLAFLERSYPLFNERCERELINGYGLVYRWAAHTGEGMTTSGSAAAAPLPIIFMAHYDVVPVEEGTEQDWTHPPFSGALADGKVWGRGTLDIKSQLTAHMEAAEALIKSGFTPARDLYFCYGHDEEVGGAQGAQRIVAHLAQKGLRFDGVLDEGGLVVTGALVGVNVALGLIGVAEKGHSNYSFEVPGMGGHSSMPPRHSSLGLAARLITCIENQPLPLRLTPTTEAMLQSLAGEMGFVVRMAMANLWLFKPLLLGILARGPVTNALVRTTCAATMAQASDAMNVLPQTTRFNVNVRILQGDTIASVKEHFERLAREAGIEAHIEPFIAEEPTAAAPVDSAFYETLETLASEFYPSALIVPYLMAGGTDSRYYSVLSDNILRFTPSHITDEERATIHSTNEALSVANYGRMIAYYEQLIRRL
jgi:carboxypeptidase PM20D1